MSSARMSRPRDKSGAAQNAANISALNSGRIDVGHRFLPGSGASVKRVAASLSRRRAAAQLPPRSSLGVHGRGYRCFVSHAAVGVLLRDWRARRRVSQLDLSLSVGVSARHLSFIETGRSRPSPEMVLALAEGLDIPLRERNTLLLAAGFAPRYQSRPLEDAALSPARDAVQRLLDAHDPYPGIVIDRCWNIVGANAAASALTAGSAERSARPAGQRVPVVPAP